MNKTGTLMISERKRTNMEPYKHTVHYYETDKMGITHHSNYVRWMEEARVDFLRKVGWDYARMEDEGIVSPVLGFECDIKKSTKFDDDVYITAYIMEMSPIKMKIGYEMKDADGNHVAKGFSKHCFLNEKGIPMRLNRSKPDFYEDMKALAEQAKK